MNHTTRCLNEMQKSEAQTNMNITSMNADLSKTSNDTNTALSIIRNQYASLTKLITNIDDNRNASRFSKTITSAMNQILDHHNQHEPKWELFEKIINATVNRTTNAVLIKQNLWKSYTRDVVDTAFKQTAPKIASEINSNLGNIQRNIDTLQQSMAKENNRHTVGPDQIRKDIHKTLSDLSICKCANNRRGPDPNQIT